MSTHLETEYKILLPKKVYDKMYVDLQCESLTPLVQVNEYFVDHQNILREKRYSLRVRHLNGTHELTLKKPKGFSKMEFNQMLSDDEYEMFKNHIAFPSIVLEQMQEIGIDILDINAITSLETIRYEIPHLKGLLCLDANTYENTKDYELEYEVEDPDTGKLDFIEFISLYGLTYQSNAKGKVARALKEVQ